MALLVTGGAGHIGSAFVVQLLDAGAHFATIAYVGESVTEPEPGEPPLRAS